MPQALTPMGEHCSTNFSSWDLAVPGSPSISRLMSPRRVSPSGSLGGNGQVGGAGTQAAHGPGWRLAPQPVSQASEQQAGRDSGLRPSFTTAGSPSLARGGNGGESLPPGQGWPRKWERMDEPLASWQ